MTSPRRLLSPEPHYTTSRHSPPPLRVGGPASIETEPVNSFRATSRAEDRLFAAERLLEQARVEKREAIELRLQERRRELAVEA